MIKCEKTIRVWFGRDNRLGFHLRLLPSLSLGQYHKDVTMSSSLALILLFFKYRTSLIASAVGRNK